MNRHAKKDDAPEKGDCSTWPKKKVGFARGQKKKGKPIEKRTVRRTRTNSLEKHHCYRRGVRDQNNLQSLA